MSLRPDPRDCPIWEPACHGSGKRRWGAARYAGREWARNKSDNIIRVATFEAAVKLADRFNAATPMPSGDYALRWAKPDTPTTMPETHRLQNTSPEETRLALYARHGKWMA